MSFVQDAHFLSVGSAEEGQIETFGFESLCNVAAVTVGTGQVLGGVSPAGPVFAAILRMTGLAFSGLFFCAAVPARPVADVG